MCQTALISSNIIRLGTRSFRQTLEAASGVPFTNGRLASLNRSLDTFYDLLYDQYNFITPADYATLGPQMAMLLDTLKKLYDICLKAANADKLSREIDRLGRNYSAFFEIDSDIRNFRLAKKHSAEFTRLLQQTSAALSHI